MDQMPLTRKTNSLEMRWCLDCHRHPEQHLRPPDEVFDMNYKAPSKQLAFGRQLVKQNNVHKEGLTDCYTCHR